MTMSHDSRVNEAIGGRVDWYLRRRRHPDGKRYTQTDLANRLGIQQSAVSKKVGGSRPFSPAELYAIAQWLDRPLSDFLPISEQMDSPPDTGHAPGDETHRLVAHALAA